MNFATKEDIEAPAAVVFAMLTDFTTIETAALRRGIDIRRTDTLQSPAAGMGWVTGFEFRGRKRKADICMTECDPHSYLQFDSVSGGLTIQARIELVALSRTRTRLSVQADLGASTLSARLLVQSLKLARNNLTKRFRLRVADYAKELEDRYQKMR